MSEYRKKIRDEGERVSTDTITPILGIFLDGGVMIEILDIKLRYTIDEDGIPQTRLIFRPLTDFRDNYNIKKEELIYGELMDWLCPYYSFRLINPMPNNQRAIITCDFRTKEEFFFTRQIDELTTWLRISESRRASLKKENDRLRLDIIRVIEKQLSPKDISDEVIEGIKDFFLSFFSKKMELSEKS